MSVLCCCKESRNLSQQALGSDHCQNGLTDGTQQGSPYISAKNLALLITSSFPFACFSLFCEENFTVSCLIKKNTMSAIITEVCEKKGRGGRGLGRESVCIFHASLPEPKHSHGGGPSVELLDSDFPSRTLSDFKDLHPGGCYYPLDFRSRYPHTRQAA